MIRVRTALEWVLHLKGAHTPDQPAVVAMGVIAVRKHVLALAVFVTLFATYLRFHRVP